QYGPGGGLTAQDALTPDAGEGNLDSTALDIAQGAAHRPRPGRDHHGLELFAVFVRFIERARIAARHDVPENGVAVVADVAQRADDSGYRHVQQHQHMRDQHETRLEGFRHDVRRASVLQLLEARVILSTHEYGHRGAQPADAAQNADGSSGVREADDHHARGVEPDLDQQVLVGGISEDHRVARLARGADARRVEIERDVFEPVRFQHPRDVLPDAPEATQDHVLAPRDLAGRRILALTRRVRRARFEQQQAGDALVVVEDERAQHHRQHDRHQQWLPERRRDELRLQPDRAQRNAELAADRDHDAGAQRLEP